MCSKTGRSWRKKTRRLIRTGSLDLVEFEACELTVGSSLDHSGKSRSSEGLNEVDAGVLLEGTKGQEDAGEEEKDVRARSDRKDRRCRKGGTNEGLIVRRLAVPVPLNCRR